MFCHHCGRRASKGSPGRTRDPFYCTGCDRTPGRCSCKPREDERQAIKVTGEKFRAQLEGGPMDGWVYDLPLAKDGTGHPVPYQRIGLEDKGEYLLTRSVYRWIGDPSCPERHVDGHCPRCGPVA